MSASRTFMSASRTVAGYATACLLLVSLKAQNRSSPAIQDLLPLDAKIIETADLRAVPGKSRQLVLWMQNPEKILRKTDHPGDVYCGDPVYGDHWFGPARLSLVDLSRHALVNTIEIRDFFEHFDDEEHTFPIPFFVSNEFYHVPSPNAEKEGTPRILNLSDLTGEGYAAQFVLFEHEVCGTALTSVLGYSRVYDLAVQYHVEVLSEKDTPSLDTWVPTIFGRKPVRPGYWNFMWEPGRGANVTIHEDVSFDRVRQLFVDKQEIKPAPPAK